jgi:hypothetical protein
MKTSRLYRKVSTCMWGDEKFRRLSHLQPSAQALWLFLLTGPHTIALPGLARASEVVLVDELGWALEDFRRCFAELEAQGMARADWVAKLVWLPKAIRHNGPENPNVLKHWSAAWELLPECALKAEAFRALLAYCRERGEGFLDTFSSSFQTPTMPVSSDVAANVSTNVNSNTHETLGQTAAKSVAVAVAETVAVPDLPSAHPPAAPLQASKDRAKSEQEKFALWFEEQRRQQLNGEWTEDQQLSSKRLNTELRWLNGSDETAVQDAVALYLKDSKRRAQDPPCSLLWFSKDRAVYLSKAKRGAA